MTLIILIACAITLISGALLIGADYGQTEGRQNTKARKAKSPRNANRKRITEHLRDRRKSISNRSKKSSKGVKA